MLTDTQYDPASPDVLSLKKQPLRHYIRKNKRPFLIGLSFLVFTNLLDGVYPLIIMRAIDQVVDGASAAEILKTSLLFFAVMATLSVTRYFWRVFFGLYHTRAAEDLRNKIFAHMTQMGPSFFQKNSIGELISLIANDVQSFRQAIGSGLLILVDGISIFLILLPLMISISWEWTWKTLILIPLVPFMIWFVTRLIFRNYKIQQDKLAELSGVSQEIVAGIRVIKGFAQEKVRLFLYNQKNAEYEMACNRVARVDAMFVPVMQFGVASGTVILLFVAANDVIAGVASVGALVAFQRFITKMVWPMTALGLGLSQYQKGMASFQRIKDQMDKQTDIPDQGTIEIEEFKELEVRNLTFSYDNGNTEQTPALSNISFRIRKGETVGLVGPVGSGKSTLLQLLLRLFPTQPQTIFINGYSIEQISQKSLRRLMILIPQDPFLFSETITSNMEYGLEAEGEEPVQKWAHVVDIDNEIEALPQKYQSQLGERGVNLSGGQKQRLTIARGLILRPNVVLIDDALSAVDARTEKKIEEHFNSEQARTKTTIIVSHRLNVIQNADLILVLKDGRLEASGQHRDLLKSSPTYKQFAEIQGRKAADAKEETIVEVNK